MGFRHIALYSIQCTLHMCASKGMYFCMAFQRQYILHVRHMYPCYISHLQVHDTQVSSMLISHMYVLHAEAVRMRDAAMTVRGCDVHMLLWMRRTHPYSGRDQRTVWMVIHAHITINKADSLEYTCYKYLNLQLNCYRLMATQGFWKGLQNDRSLHIH